MPVKITVKHKPKSKPKPIDWENLPGGTVVKFYDKSIGLVYNPSAKLKGGIVIIHGLGDSTIADGYQTMEITEILGKLTEIIVEEN